MFFRFEKTQRDKVQALKHINAEVAGKFREKEGQNFIVRDNDLRRWALQINREMTNRIDNFKAGRKWLINFKNSNRIASRKVILHFLNERKFV